MVEKKLVNRNIVIALAVVCLALVISLAVAVTDYTSMLNSKGSQTATQNSQITNLQSQIANLTAPNLIWTQLGGGVAQANSSLFMIAGGVSNTGTQPAYNVKLHVVAYTLDGTKVIDSYMSLGTITGHTIYTFNSYGTGSLMASPAEFNVGNVTLNNWTITPSWSSTP